VTARILLVEDDPLSRRLLRDLLTHRGHQIFEATTVDEARLQIEAVRPQLILLDVQIPGGGGETLLDHIRSRAQPGRVPVLAVTALASKQDGERLIRLGFDAYFSKPISTQTFGPAMESFLK
jgi:CheY-like chemotaxis protein